MKLNEIKKPDPVDPNEAVVEQFMEEHEIGKYEIVNGKVDVDAAVIVYLDKPFPGGKLPFAWGHVNGWFQFPNAGLSSFENFPSYVQGTCDLTNNKFKDLDGLDGSQKYGAYRFNRNPIKSLKNIHKHITETQELNFDGCPIENSILGLILIDKLRFLNDHLPKSKDFEIFEPSRKKDKLEYVDKVSGEIFTARDTAFMIVKKYLGKGQAGVLEAQEELIDLELDDYAEL